MHSHSIFCGLAAVKKPSILEDFALYPFSLQRDRSATSEVDFGRGEIADALVIASEIVVGDEYINLCFES